MSSLCCPLPVRRFAGRTAVVGLAAIALGLVAAVTGSGGSMVQEGPPRLAGADWLRSAGIAALATATMVGARRLALGRLQPHAGGGPGGGPALAAAAGGLGAALSLGAALLVVAAPRTFSNLVREDGPVEWASAGLLAVAAATASWAGVRHCRQPGRSRTGLVCLAAAAALVVLALEEVSFFQRQLDISSPGMFLNGNAQKELNLHNFATTATGQLYYFGAFVACVVLPAVIGDRRLEPGRLEWLTPLLPPPVVLYGSVTAAAVTYEMWNVVPLQFTFWASLVVLVTRAVEGRAAVGAGLEGPGRHRARPQLHLLAIGLPLGLVAVLTGVLAAFLGAGPTMVRSWDDTELRELLIPFGLALYGLALLLGAGVPAGTGAVARKGAGVLV